MGKETVWQRRARKRGSAKADYYPKVDLADETGSDALERVEALAVAERSAEPVSDVDAAELAALEFAAAEPLAAANDSDPAEPEPAVEPLDVAELVAPESAAPVSLEFDVEPAPAASAPVDDADAVKLAEFLDLAAAAPLVATLLERRGKPIVIDGSAVHQLGAQCVQVLLSAKRTWSADGASLSIVNCAPRMIEDLRSLGIEPATLISGDFSQ